MGEPILAKLFISRNSYTTHSIVLYYFEKPSKYGGKYPTMDTRIAGKISPFSITLQWTEKKGKI